MLNKKIASEIALGIIVLLALLIGGIFWMQGKNSVTENAQQATDNQKMQKQIDNIGNLKLVSGNIDDPCSRPVFQGNVKISGWMVDAFPNGQKTSTFITSYPDEHILPFADKKNKEGILVNSYLKISNLLPEIEKELQQADRDNPKKIMVQNYIGNCGGYDALPEINVVPFDGDVAVDKSDIKAFIKSDNGKTYVILQENGVEKIIDQGDASYNKEHSNINEVKGFSDVKLSPHKDYVTYNMTGWEWSYNYLYDIKKGSSIMEQSSASTFEFTSDEKYFISCGSSIFDGTLDGKIFTAGDFKTPIFDVFKYAKDSVKDYIAVDCKIEGENVSFNLNNDDLQTIEKKPKNKTVVYSLSENRAIK